MYEINKRIYFVSESKKLTPDQFQSPKIKHLRQTQRQIYNRLVSTESRLSVITFSPSHEDHWILYDLNLSSINFLLLWHKLSLFI